ncbi:patatin-like phospholipase family protein [Rubrimonas cliftonensis]|uniref:patatin-like phospholipase family protein n=1 Tax=Rubrimonas cliftonensis TaxID=89524 RepID=UPI000B872E63|nr:patatin-like phospholipase family protein [Rubrimonas cliftonensis]
MLDKLLEEDRLWIEAISGTSAGAMNAVVLADGMHRGGAEGARQALRDFWKAVSDSARMSPLRSAPMARMTGDWSLAKSPIYAMFDFVNRILSPYERNPLNINPLRDVLARSLDFDRLRTAREVDLFITATHVRTGRARVFRRHELSADVLMASACLPLLHQAVMIDGEPYWDGGYSGNPVLFPFFESSPADDILIVQLNPIVREDSPSTAPEILNRITEITFNSPLLHELRAIDFVKRMLEAGHLSAENYRRMHIHVISSRKRLRKLDASTKLNVEWPFLNWLFEVGRETAERWLAENFDVIGVHSTVNVREMFDGSGELPIASPSGGA